MKTEVKQRWMRVFKILTAPLWIPLFVVGCILMLILFLAAYPFAQLMCYIWTGKLLEDTTDYYS